VTVLFGGADVWPGLSASEAPDQSLAATQGHDSTAGLTGASLTLSPGHTAND
jgi:hypothetical protein